MTRTPLLGLATICSALLFACGGDDGGNQTDTAAEDTSVPGDGTDTTDTSDTSAETVDDTAQPDTSPDTTAETSDDTTAETSDDTADGDTSEDGDLGDTNDTSDDTADTDPGDTNDTAETDTAVFCPDTNRPDGCACENDVDCGSGFCASGPVGDYCASRCDGPDDCTGGATCVIPPGDTDGVCLVEIDLLCAPCKTNNDCQRAGGDATCVPLGVNGSEGSFCATSCDEENPCFDGYSCTAGYCVPDSGTCECSEVASAIAASTECRNTNGLGSCVGERICGLNGTLSPCNAQTPTAEVCDGLDNDCNPNTPESNSLCDDGDACTTNTCNGVNGCQFAPSTGNTCDDGNACTGPDTCNNGVCGGPDTCPCTPETAATDCDSPPLGQDIACLTPTCVNNACVYTPKDGTCNDGSLCTSNDTCSAGACVGTTVDCNDNITCTVDSCAPATGCSNTPFFGTCEDGDPCTVGDTCATGVCLGNPLDCSGLDGTCHQGVCDGNGACFAQPLQCGITAVRFQTPSAALSKKGAGNTWIIGSAGHTGPTGTASSALRRVQFGFHPGMHR